VQELDQSADGSGTFSTPSLKASWYWLAFAKLGSIWMKGSTKADAEPLGVDTPMSTSRSIVFTTPG
jgi:hypothetical protein